jgi:signal transduction histidine kinase
MTAEHLKSEAFLNQTSQLEAATKRKSLEMKRLFVRYVSHEIRTPLSTCAVGLELIKSLRSTGIDEVLERAGKSSNRAEEASDEFLEVRDPQIQSARDSLSSLFDMVDEVKVMRTYIFSILFLHAPSLILTSFSTTLQESCDLAVGILNDLLLVKN